MRRLQAGLSLREASAISSTLAASLGDDRFFAAPGTLSDYEAREDPPRHMHKIITLCCIYGVRLREIMAAIGANTDELGQQGIPSLRFQTSPRPTHEMQTLFSELNAFLELAAAPLTGMKRVSIRDCFWNGRWIGEKPLRDALIFVVNRKRKHRDVYSIGGWRQQLFVVWERDRGYRIGTPLGKDRLQAVDKASGDRDQWAENEFEILGQIVTVVREVR
jgi:hypothetical protein